MANIFSYQNEDFHTGDTVKLHLSVTEGDKTRTQIFEGLIIAISGEGAGKSFVVRKIGANAIGVERIMPVMCPTLTKIEKKSEGNVRRSKLYYLRDRIGKQALKVKIKLPETKKQAEARMAKEADKSAKVEASTAKKEAKTGAKKTAGKSGRTASKAKANS